MSNIDMKRSVYTSVFDTLICLTQKVKFWYSDISDGNYLIQEHKYQYSHNERLTVYISLEKRK